jgi:hypothetical protein
VLYRLVSEADVFAENFRPGVKHRLGIDYGALALNPQLVYVRSASPDGPYADGLASIRSPGLSGCDVSSYGPGALRRAP